LKLNKKMLRLGLIAAVTTGVCFPLLNQLRNSKAKAENPPAGAPVGTEPAKSRASAFPEVDPKKVVLSVGDEKVTAGEFKIFFTELDPALQQRVLARPEAKRQLADQYIDMKLMASEAKRLKLDESTRVRTTYEQLLANALMVNLAEEKAANLKFFEQNKEWFVELQARHILIAVAGSGIETAKLTDAQAKAKADELKSKLDKGADFAAMARTESDDRGSAATGGSLGMMTRGQMVPPFEDAAYALKDNEISQPVKTQFGYHIIQVLSRTPASYDNVVQRVPRRRLELLIEQLKKAQKPEIDDSFFGTSTAAPKAEVAPGK